MAGKGFTDAEPRRSARMWSRCARCTRPWRGSSRRRTAATCSRSSSGRCARAGSSSRARATCARSRSGARPGCLSRRRRGRSAACMMPFPAAWPPRARLPSSRRSGCGSCRRARFALEICAWLLYNQTAEFAGVMELVDVLDSKSSAARRAGSSPATGTTASEQSLLRSKSGSSKRAAGFFRLRSLAPPLMRRIE